jgi:tetratricopeptide (TPR) repeat protein
MLQPGSQFARYEIQRRLGRGGMGTVYVAHDPVLGRMVAIKVFLTDLDLPDAAERFAREARAAAALSHPNIVTIHDFGEFASQPYIVMEYVPGETIAEVIRRRAPIALAEKLRWMEELCSGAAYAHQIGVIHRDIKPTNLMVDRSGRLKILDFGIARMLGGTPASNATALIGTPGYMAPEQILGGAVDHRADLFSIGVVCYELLSYTEAFPGETVPAITHRIVSGAAQPLSEVLPDVLPELSATVARALEKSAADRFPSADALRAALGRARRQLESDPGWEGATLPGRGTATPAPTLSRPGTGSVQQRIPDAIGVAELTPPPDPRRVDREALAKRRAAQIEASLQQARSLLHAGDLDAAMEACVQALTLDDTHAEALEVEAAIKTAMARQRAGVLLEEAREQLGRGALTGAQGLLQQARELDPDAVEARRLDRDLRLARAEQERLRQRAAALSAAVASSRRALAAGEIEAALAFAREACELDPAADEARGLEAEALRRLDEETGSTSALDQAEPTMLRSPAPPAAPAGDAAPTLIAPSARRTPGPAASVPVAPAAAAPSPTAVRDAPAPVPRKTPPAAGPAAAKAAPRDPWASVRPVAAGAAAWLRSTTAALQKMPRRQRLIAASAVGLAALAIVVAVTVALLPPAVVPTGGLVIEAVPWATVVEVRSEDGTIQPLPAVAATPLLLTLPVGSYQVRLAGPPPGSEQREVTIQVTEGAVSTPPATLFRVVTPEDYFERYLASAPVAEPPVGEGAEPPPGAAGDASGGTASAPPVPARPAGSTPAPSTSGGDL